jgi:hypothetical protein
MDVEIGRVPNPTGKFKASRDSRGKTSEGKETAKPQAEMPGAFAASKA